ncbi:MAG: hypothetical protein R6X18_09795 [Chloroflexota bacterium]|jgi:hypothetical protein
MSTEKPSNGVEDSKEVDEQPDASKRAKKPRSLGFIESTGFKPNWLETGPLMPEMLAVVNTEGADQTKPTNSDSRNEEMQGSPSDPEVTHSTRLPDPLNVDHEEERDAGQILAGDKPPATGEQDTIPPELLALIAAWEDDQQYPEDVIVDDDKGEWERIMESFPPATADPVSTTEQAMTPPSPPANVKRKRRDRLSIMLLIISILLLATAAFLYFVNPFTRLALGSALLARPEFSPDVVPPRTAGSDWCIRGDFLQSDSALPRLVDAGTQGDILSGDRVFSLEATIPRAGTYEWQVIGCDDLTLAYPPAPAWIRTERDNQAVTFLFDSNEREDPLFFPIAYVVTAIDSSDQYRVVGSFQDWNPADTTSDLNRIHNGLYQQVRRIAQPGAHQAHIIDPVSQKAVDAYGRATDPIPFSFETSRNSEYVVFLLDTDRGRASVLYDVSPILSSLAFSQGHIYLSLALVVLAGLILIGALLRQLVLRNRGLWLESGCPDCGEHELMRIARRDSDRMLHYVDIPAYRYRCRNCTWEGVRLSEDGAIVSPGVSITSTDIFHSP